MTSHHATRLHLAVLCIVLACLEAGERANAHGESANASVCVAVTVLDKEVCCRPVKPSIVAQKRAQLSAADFAKWQSESRWRPLVGKVSYHVMSDWAKRHNIRPTRDEIEEHFGNEARQHLQAYSTPEGKQQVALAIGWSSASAVEWVTAKALHDKYGGRIALSSFGAWIAIDGRNAILKEYAAAGKIRFHDPETEQEFWAGVDNPAVLDVTLSDPQRIARRLASPPWEGWGARTAQRFKEHPELFGLPKGE